jgi:two-component system, cell cycle sensor histidine kinase and response regulator CckA
LQEVADAAERAASLTRQLLTFSRKNVNRPVLMDLNECVRRMETMLRRLIGEDVELITRLSAGPCTIRADVGQIEQVIMNLAVNAREAMPAGGKLVFETKVVPAPPPSAGTVHFSATDTGCGMNEEVRAHIFEPFFTTKLGTGTGLGLSTVFGIVEQNGGTVEVTSQVGHGSTFSITIPSAAGEVHAIGEARHLAPLAGAGTILLVEDESSVRQLARQILEDSGYEVLTAGSGADATDLCMEFSRKIDLLITDVVMPKMSGPELVQQLTNARPGLRVLYLSGYTDKNLAQKIKLTPENNFLQKPFSPQGLAQAVRVAMGPS